MIPIQDDISEALKTISNNINTLTIAIMEAGGSHWVLADSMNKPLSEFMDMLARNNIYIKAQYRNLEDK